jgi:4-diphosphocytidyl-2-C-methyl-D-erythritol kinase
VASKPDRAAVTVNACAKINLTLRVTDARADGYHGLRTVFQSLAVHDTLTFWPTRGPFRVECDDPGCPTDRTNLVWRAAALVWRAIGRRGELRDATVRIAKRIPLQSGLGGGSSDAAAAIRAAGQLWGAAVPPAVAHRIARRLGADVPFFLEGGTALGLDRGDLLFPLLDLAPAWVTLVIPPFGVSTKDAYQWFDAGDVLTRHAQSSPGTRDVVRGGPGGARGVLAGSPGARYRNLPIGEFRNDLQAPVAARQPDIARIVRALRRQDAEYAAMSGSGSVVFGIFASRALAVRAARKLATAGRRAVVTRTIDRAGYAAVSAPK